MWDFTEAALTTGASLGGRSRFTVHAVNLWKYEVASFDEWTESFMAKVLASGTADAHWLMGYSLGGRLALHALLANSSLWKGVIVIAAGLGYASSEERSRQRAKDRYWGERFLVQDWESLLAEWDALPVFGGQKSTLLRKEAMFSRHRVAHMFDVFSKGNQKDLLPEIQALKRPPLLYISGQNDAKYRSIGELLQATCPIAIHAIIRESCHRVPWENQSAFIDAVQHFIDSID